MWIIYTEIHEKGNFNRWFDSRWKDRDYANEMADRMNRERKDKHVFKCVCPEEDAKMLGIKNMPN